ncbi:MAG: S1 RNA-binding domain-containing protein [Chloroflexi bacterium]|nr:S1 RNA-binding domain-containing protein [Chloroflexota bacterium]
MTDLLLQEAKKKEESPMWSYLQQEEYDYKQPKRGDIISDGVVLSKSSDEILVDVGLKLEAVVPQRDLEKLEPAYLDEIHVGDKVPVFVLQPEDQEGRLVVSLNMARTLKDWKKAEEMMESGEMYETTVTNFNKGGVIVPFFGLRGFVPASQLVTLPKHPDSGQRIDRLSEMIDQPLRLKIIEVNRRRRRLIMSERAAMREWRKEQKERLLQNLKPGDVCHGVVTNLMNFGAFVDLGGADGLVHVSEISWHRVKHPRDVLQIGQEVDVFVLSMDPEKERIALSIKKLQPDPWTLTAQNHAIGDLVEGDITNVTDFGAFARLPEGIEGLIHVSELADGPVEDARKIIKKGDHVVVRIINMDVDRKRIGLSLRRAQEKKEAAPATEEPLPEEEAPATAESPPADEIVAAAEASLPEEAAPATAEPPPADEIVAAAEEPLPEEAAPATAESPPADEIPQRSPCRRKQRQP